MNFESLIFDIDGTLWDSRALVAKGYNVQLKEAGLGHIVIDADILKTVFGKTITEIANILFAELPAQESYLLLEKCLEQAVKVLHEDPCNIGYPKVKETLTELAKKHRIFIVSNSQKGYPELCIEKLGLQDLIVDHLCFGDTGACKGETIKKIMADNRITSACYVGDTRGDMEASDYAGIPFIYCTFGFGEADHYLYKIDSFEQLLEL